MSKKYSLRLSARPRYFFFSKLSDEERARLRQETGYTGMPKTWMPDPVFAATFTIIDLLSHPNFGRKSVAEVEQWLQRHGLKLKEYCPGDKHKG